MAVKPRLWTRGFILDTLVNFLIYIIYYMLVVIIASEAISSLNATVSEAGLAAGIFVLGTLAARLAAGRSVEIYGRKKMLYGGILFYLVTTCMYFAVDSLPLMYGVRFLNGIGYGIDGYCCEKGDELRGNGNGEVNYTAIAIKGLLFHYKPTGATITVDGVEHRFEKVWLAPTMIGRYYGGGMMPTPEQDRLNGDGAVSVMVYYGSGKLKSLAVFPSIFKGEHIKHSEMVAVLSGRNITVCFDEPRPLQIDGETVPGVREYSVTACEEKVLQPA